MFCVLRIIITYLLAVNCRSYGWHTFFDDIIVVSACGVPQKMQYKMVLQSKGKTSGGEGDEGRKRVRATLKVGNKNNLHEIASTWEISCTSSYHHPPPPHQTKWLGKVALHLHVLCVGQSAFLQSLEDT